MAVRHISFTIEDADIPLLEELVTEFGCGNRSEFLRVAMADYEERLRKRHLEERRKGMEELHAEMLKERGGRFYTTEETLKLIDDLRIP